MFKNITLFIFVLFNFLCSALNAACPPAYGTCNLGKPGYVNVHIVPHTHDDVGWLKTVDQYYYGSNTDQQEASVQYILDTVVPELLNDPKKRFVYVEIAYFWRWWNEQSDSTKQAVRMLVNEGRLEFVIGAWCMNDEATTYYNDIIDQQTLGFKFILKEFGECARPRSAWQIDPFGHSREQASLFAQFGFDGLFLGRVDYQDFDNRGSTKTREMLWQASANLDNFASTLFTGVLPNGYNPPPGFCFDTYCGDEPIMDDPNLEDYNVDTKVDSFLNYTLDQLKVYKTSNLIMTMGSDFQYSNAHMWYKNLDKLIHYVNERQQTNGSKINIFYSTPACYLYSLNMANETWGVKTDDFFPYAHRPHAFWTGYFTSRAALKDYVRKTNNYLQTVRQLAALARLNDTDTASSISELERAMGVAQHHDAVSGTERQHVANDYSKRLARGINDCVDVISKSLSQILVQKFGFEESLTNVQFCSLLNISQCEPIEGQNQYTTVIYNPLPRAVKSWARLPIVTNDYAVYDAQSGEVFPSEITPVYDTTKAIPERKSRANFNLVFEADLPALGFKVYIISRNSTVASEQSEIEENKANPFSLSNEHISLSFDSNGNLLQIDNLDTKISTPLTQQFCFYKSMPGNNSDSQFQASGAYVFRPATNDSTCLSVAQYSLYSGKQFDELHQIFNSWISQTIRLYKGSTNVEFEWQVGPIDTNDAIGKEVVAKFKSDLKSSSTFYTDSNGREILTRVRNFRPTWKLDQSEYVSGNYYPINSRIFIRDEAGEDENIFIRDVSRQLTVVTDRSQGGSSIEDGSIEIMVHRRVLNDDALGVAEPLNERGANDKGLIISGLLHLVFNTTANSAPLHRELAHEINNKPLTVFATNSLAKKSKKLKSLAGLSLLNIELPSNIHLLTLMNDNDADNDLQNAIIIRLEHFYEKNDDPVLSQPVTVDLQQVFGESFQFLGIEELALGANMKVDELNNRLSWKAEETVKRNINKYFKTRKYNSKFSSAFSYTFYPMQIRTFRVWYSPK